MASHENLPYNITGVCRCKAVGTINKEVRTTTGKHCLSSWCERLQSCKQQPLSTAKAEALRHSATGQIQFLHKQMGCHNAQCPILASDLSHSLAIEYENIACTSRYTREPVYSLGFILDFFKNSVWSKVKEYNPSEINKHILTSLPFLPCGNQDSVAHRSQSESCWSTENIAQSSW